MEKKTLEGIYGRKYRDLTWFERVLRFFGLLVPDVVVLDFNGSRIPKMEVFETGKMLENTNDSFDILVDAKKFSNNGQLYRKLVVAERDVHSAECTIDVKPFPLLDNYTPMEVMDARIEGRHVSGDKGAVIIPKV